MRKPLGSAVLGLALLLVGLVFGLFRPAVAAPVTKSLPLGGQGANDPIVQTSNELTETWLAGAGSEGWLVVSYKDELTGELGADPETGWPLANQALWEMWYTLDAAGRNTTVLVRHTDPERGNVTRVAWEGGVLLRDPSGVREPGHDWETYRPVRDHFCNSRLPDFLGPSGGDVMRQAVAEWTTDTAGASQWTVTMTTRYPPTGLARDPNTYVATELTCSRNGATGAMEGTEEVYVTDRGERVLKQRTYDYTLTRVVIPPAEMLALLDQLRATGTP